MSLENQLLEILAADATVFALAGDNLRHEWRDQNDRSPGVTIFRISDAAEFELDLAATAFERSRVQLDCFAEIFEECSELADAVRSALHGYSGVSGAYTIDSITFENRVSLGEQDGDRVQRRISLDFFVKYQ